MTDDFDAIVAGLDLQEPDDQASVRDLSDSALVSAYNRTRRELNSLPGNQMHKPDSPEARDLHSQRTAMVVELRRRGLT